MSHHTLHGLEKNTSLVAQGALAHRLQNDNIHKRAPILGNGILGPYTFMSSHKKNQSSTINNGFAVCILNFAPFIDIELPLESSWRELQIWAMGFWVLIHS